MLEYKNPVTQSRIVNSKEMFTLAGRKVDFKIKFSFYQDDQKPSLK